MTGFAYMERETRAILPAVMHWNVHAPVDSELFCSKLAPAPQAARASAPVLAAVVAVAASAPLKARR